jgi:hypothetical protein
LYTSFRRRDGRVAEGARLESVFTRKGNVGSNPTLSAITSLFPNGVAKIDSLP